MKPGVCWCLASKKRIVLFSLSLSSLCSQILYAYQIDPINSDRIGVAYEEIKKDFEQNAKLRLLAQGGEYAMMAVILGIAYRWYNSLSLTDKERKMVEHYRNNDAVHQSLKHATGSIKAIEDSGGGESIVSSSSFGTWLSKSLKRLPSSASPQETIVQGPPTKPYIAFTQRIMNQFSRDALITRFKGYGSFVSSIVFPSALGWLFQNLLGGMEEKLRSVNASRTIHWFMAKRTKINDILEEMKHLVISLEPQSNVFDGVLVDISPAQSVESEFVDELVRLKLLANVMTTQPIKDEADANERKKKLVERAQSLVYEIERVIAFIHYRYSEDTYGENVLARECAQVCKLLTTVLNGESHESLVSAVFRIWLQINHVTAHLAFEEKKALALLD